MTRRFNFYQKSKKKFNHHFDIHVSKIFQVYFLTGKYKLLIDFYNKEETHHLFIAHNLCTNHKNGPDETGPCLTKCHVPLLLCLRLPLLFHLAREGPSQNFVNLQKFILNFKTSSR